MTRCLIYTIALIVAFNGVYSQKKDTLLLMNGQIVVEKIVDTLIGAVTIVNPKKPKSNIHYDYDQVYCIKYANKKTKYFYSQDSLRGNFLTKSEMKYYIYGERDARKGFRAPGSFIGAAIFGIASGGVGLFFAPIFPYGYMGLTGIPKVRIRHSTISNPDYINYDAYILGYQRVARTKRKLKALIGGTVGLAIGYGLYFGVFKENLPTFKLSF